MAREKLGQFLRTLGGESATDSISYAVDPRGNSKIDRGDDLGVDPGTNKSLLPGENMIGHATNSVLDQNVSEEALLTNWVSWLQTNADMLFRVGPEGQFAVPSNRGEYLAMAELQGVDTSSGTPATFVTRANPSEKLGATLSQYSNSGKFDLHNPAIGTEVGGALRTLIDKHGIGDQPSDKTGHYLLASIEGSEKDKSGNTIINTDDSLLGDRGAPQAATKIAQSENRFRSGPGSDFTNAYANKGENITPQAWDEKELSTNQRDFGAYDLNAEAVIFEQLKKVGLSLMIQAAGYDYPQDPGKDGEVFRNSLDPDRLGSFPESSADDSVGGVRVTPGSLKPRSTPTAPNVPQGTGETIAQGAVEPKDQSYGAFSTPNTPFSGPSADLMPAQAAAALLLMGVAMSKIDETISKVAKGRKSNLGRGPYMKGESSQNTYADPKLRLLRNLLLVPTQRSYGECVSFGTEIIFGGKNLDFATMRDTDNLSNSAGYYMSVARSVLRSAGSIQELFGGLSNIDLNVSNINTMLDTFGRSRVLGMLNTIALIGNIGYMRSAGSANVDASVNGKGPYDVDKLADSPASRIMKNRSGGGFTNMALSWRNNSLPALYMIPKNVMRASIRMGTGGTGTNPLKGMLVSSLANKTYIDMNLEGSAARIPNDIVERMENALDAEYVPFYFHDLRTNEIVSFHAFLSSLTDEYTVNRTETEGYGRIDPVQTYKSTTRSIGFSFHIVATSQEDFDEMWFKINKLTTLAYPQWTKGVTLQDSESGAKFVQPFSQIMGSTPITRLRIGDVIKSNYSKFHLSRVFGMGEKDTSVGPLVGGKSSVEGQQAYEDVVLSKVFAIAFGSPLSHMTSGFAGERAVRSVASQFLINGFANPLTLLFTRVLRDPDSVQNTAPMGINLASVGQAALGLLEKGMADASMFGYHFGLFVFLKATTHKPYTFGNGEQYMFSRPIRGFVIGRRKQDVHLPVGSATGRLSNKGSNYTNSTTRTIYTIAIVDFAVPASLFGKTVDVTHSDIISDPNGIFNTFVLPFLDWKGALKNVAQGLINEVSVAAGIPVDQIQPFATDEAKFMSEDNAIVKSFNATRGRGLAGIVSSIRYNWLDEDNTTWEIDWNSRAPKICKVDIAFLPIHDIPPGLGHDGYNRAPIYNVGRVMRYVAGDPYDDDGAASKFSYDNANRATFRKVGEQADEDK